MAQITKNDTDTFGQIQDMLKAYYPILYLTTFEYDRTKQKLRGVAKNLNKNFQFYWLFFSIKIWSSRKDTRVNQWKKTKIEERDVILGFEENK